MNSLSGTTEFHKSFFFFFGSFPLPIFPPLWGGIIGIAIELKQLLLTLQLRWV